MELPEHAITWFEIPVTDFDRARTFYSAILEFTMPERQMGPNRMGILPYQKSTNGAAIVQGDTYVPSKQGCLGYLNAGADLSEILARVEPAGGKVLTGKTLIQADVGCYAVFEDTEGNRIGLHSSG